MASLINLPLETKRANSALDDAAETMVSVGSWLDGQLRMTKYDAIAKTAVTLGIQGERLTTAVGKIVKVRNNLASMREELRCRMANGGDPGTEVRAEMKELRERYLSLKGQAERLTTGRFTTMLKRLERAMDGSGTDRTLLPTVPALTELTA